jgi:hypothetical protein
LKSNVGDLRFVLADWKLGNLGVFAGRRKVPFLFHVKRAFAAAIKNSIKVSRD